MAKKNIKREIPTELVGHHFENPALLEEALTHPSLSGTYNYQRLEFLGDRVLGLVISTWLLEAFPNEAEGSLNRRYASLVRKETLAEMAVKLGIVDAIFLTPGAETEGTRTKEAVQSDVCESVIGAIYLDAGFEAVNKFIRQHWIPLAAGAVLDAVRDSKTLLQEWCQARALPLPIYTVTDRTGPDHDPIFKIKVTVEGKGAASAKGSAKRLAEQASAQMLYKKLSGEN
ncbi:MAG: ribonuclease III [Kordiimonadales bacterium]|nr:MAG: ribonuclease III [Kordiimonadales bacterium]